MSPDVSRHLTESHVTPLSLTALCPSFFPSFFFILCLRFRYHRDSFRHLKFLLLYAFAYNSDPVRFPPSNFSFSSLHVATYFSRTCDFRFCYRTRRSTISVFFYFLLFLYILSSFFSLSLIFAFGFVIFFPLSQFFSILSHFISFYPPNVFGRIFRFDMSLPFYRDLFSFYFFLSFASSASFESAFPRALFISLALFHASFPFSSNLFLYFVSFPFFSPLPSLIPLFLSFSLLHRPRFTLIAHKEK